MRDPRVDPRPGDVIDDDPPLPPLLVSRSSRPGEVVVAARYTQDPTHPLDCGCEERCACVWLGSWNIDDWRDEMAGARVVHVSPDGSLPESAVYETDPDVLDAAIAAEVARS